MGHPAGKKEEGRANILASAGRGFRKHGYAGLGINGLAQAAGVTSGGFYAHFKSKSHAFRAAIAAGIGQLREGIEDIREASGTNWAKELVDFYLTERRNCDLEESCALQSLGDDIARADAKTKTAYEGELQRVIEVMGKGESGLDRAQAIALLALLSGGVSMARSASDPQFAQEIADAVKLAAGPLGRR